MPSFRFGVLIPPFHPLGDDPTLCLERDLQTITHLDSLGYDEVWVGEHHSAGIEIIASPELIITAAAERTKRIRLGTGVCSLPYQHPLILADRMVQLHHMTRGRAMFGAGPGALPSDAFMMGIDPVRQRDMMEEALSCIVRLFRGETVTYSCDWFKLKDARLQLPFYNGEMIEVCTACMVSPSGPRLAGKLGTGLLSLSATAPEAITAAGNVWKICTDMADKHGTQVDRANWRMVGLMHVAETREQALKDVTFGLEAWVKYFEDVAVVPITPPERRGDPVTHLIESGRAIIGTPDDCLAQIQRLQEVSGGFGCFLINDHNWAPFDRKLKSYELIARYVFPKVKGLNATRKSSYEWAGANHKSFRASAQTATQAHIDRHLAERGNTGPKQ